MTDRGEGVEGAKLYFEDDFGIQVSTTALELGYFGVDQFHSGRWRVHITASACVPWGGEIAIECSSSPCVRDFVVQVVRQFAVRFLDADGRALPTEFTFGGESTVLCPVALACPEPPCAVGGTVSSPPREWNALSSNQWSRFEPYAEWLLPRETPPWELSLTADCAGRLEIRDPTARYACAFLDGLLAQVVPIEGDRGSVEFRLDIDALAQAFGAGLRATVVDAESGAPLAGATVGVAGRTWAFAAADGSIRMDKLVPGAHLVEISQTYYAGLELAVDLVPNRTMDLGEIRLALGTRIRGRVVDPNGKGIADAFISCAPPGVLLAPGNIYSRTYTRTRADGSFQFIWMGAGPGLLRCVSSASSVVHTWAPAVVEVNVPQGGLDDVELKLVAGTATRVQFIGADVERIEYGVRTPSGLPLLREFTDVIGADLWLVPGDYELIVSSDQRFAGRMWPFHVGADATHVTIDLGDR